MQTKALCGMTLIVALFGASCKSAAPKGEKTFGESEWKRSAILLRPGEPGKAPFWNVYAKRFIYAPAFDFQPVANAARYKFEITSEKDAKTRSFESDVPYAPLSPVWASVPVGYFDIKVTGVSAKREAVGVAGEGRFYRAAPFNGPYLEAVMPYDRSGRIALDKIMHKPYVEYWLAHKEPDHSYQFYQYPAKLYGSLVVGAVAHAKVNAGTDEAKRATELARIVADYLISITFSKGSPLEYFPPTYYGPRIGRNPKSQAQAQLTTYMVIAAAESGHAYLDLYDLTGDTKYLDAAKNIARTYLKTQLPNGSWYLYINTETGKPMADPLAIPTSTIAYFDRLKNDYGMEGLDEPIRRAFDWIMANPVKTFHWLSQYEDVDVRSRKPYQKMSREQACDLAIYLYRKYPNRADYVELAEDLIRFAEDQFITWEQMEDLLIANGKVWRPPPDDSKAGPGWYSRNWLLPVVHEQYGFWMPSARNTGLMIETYWAAYVATGKNVHLAKAISIANNFTRVQSLHDGDYPTMFTKYPMNFWINNSIYPAKVMMKLQEDLEQRKLAPR